MKQRRGTILLNGLCLYQRANLDVENVKEGGQSLYVVL